MHKKHYEGLSGGIFLIGLGFLFLVPGIGFWPWVLVVIGASSLPASLAAKRGWYGWQSFFWMCGLAVLFATGLIWPGILILVGASALIGALTKGSEGSPFDAELPSDDNAIDSVDLELDKDDGLRDAFNFDDSPPTRPVDMNEIDGAPTNGDRDSDHSTRRLEE